jgi:hypothetical protein
MKIIYFKANVPNFGDELNPWMWPQFFPTMFDEDDSEVFLGIGSIIGAGEIPAKARKIIFGAAYVPEYKKKPDISENYEFHFVRGPRTASLLGLDPSLALSDSATLLHVLMKDRPRKAETISFMPHWESACKGNWEAVCALAGLNYIDPRCDVNFILKEMLRSKYIITEAMHGAIVADALRIPWIPIRPIRPLNRAKWTDWSDTINLQLPHHALYPSSVSELRGSVIRKIFSAPVLKKAAEELLLHKAAEQLSKASSRQQMISKDTTFFPIVEQMLDKVENLKQQRMH